MTLLALLAALFSASAHAQSGVYNWTGFYTGIHGGGAWGTAKGSDTPSFSLFTEETKQSASGGFGGVQFGYNVQFGRAVWGVELSGSYGDVRGTGSCMASVPSPFLNCETKLDWTIQMLARFGYAMGDGRFLPYITGGAVLSRIGINRVFDVGIPEVWGEKRWTPGGAIGAGFEYAFGNGFSLGLEYLYTGYFNQNYSTLISCGCDSVSEQSLNTHSVRVSLNYTFGSPPKVQDGMHATLSAQTGVYDWTGFYVGGHTGWQHATQSGGSQEILYTDNQSFDAGLSGLQFGYNYQIDRFIFGLEVSGTLPWKGSSSEFCDSTGLLLCRTRQEWSSSFLARFGYAMGGGRLMPYVVSGLSLARLKFNYDA
ncbi:MAG: outer membrane protein, partial [bacterium]